MKIFSLIFSNSDPCFFVYSTLGESWVREGYGSNPVLTDKGLQRIARRYDADIPRVVLRWAVDNDVIVIPRSSNPHHIATNLNIEKMNLAPYEVDYINSLNNLIDLEASAEEIDVQGVQGATDKNNVNKLASAEQKANKIPAETVRLESSAEAKAHTELNSSAKRHKEFVYNNVIYEEVNFDRPTIYVSSDDHWIYAFDAETGSIKWKTETADETGSSCAFSLNEEIVYCGADDSYIRALHAKNGTLLWYFKTSSSVTSSSHVSKDGTLLIGSHDSFLYALHPNGTLRWKFKTTDAIWSSPVSNRNGDLVFIASYAETGKNIFAIDIKTGKLVWNFEGLGGFISSPVLSPDESLVVFCSGYGIVYALDSWTGDLSWQAEFDGPVESTPVFARNSKLFIASYYGELAALDARNGRVLWRKQGKHIGIFHFFLH